MIRQTVWQKYGAHFIGYVISALTVVLTYIHHCGAPVSTDVARWVGIGGAVLIGLNHLQSALRAPIAPASGSSKQSGRATVGLLLALASSVAVIMAGCASLSGSSSSVAATAAVQAAVDLGVGTFIQQTAKTPAAQAQEAQQITMIAAALEGVLTGNQATLAALDQMLQTRIAAANLPPPDKAAALILAQTIQSIVMQQIQAGTSAGGAPPLSASQVVAIKTVLDDVLQAASFYNVHAMAVMRADTVAPR
jgi:hypothetical protein